MLARLRYFRAGAIAVLFSLTACHGVTTAPQTKKPIAIKAPSRPKPKPSPSALPATPTPSASVAASAAPSPTPTPLPSVALVLTGKVTIDPRALLTAGMAERTGSGVKLIGNHGAGLISDKGLGIISQNGGSLIGKTKYALTQADGAEALTPVEGIVVEAFDLLTGQLAAGPVATDATGGYKLGFLETPSANLHVVARVNNTADTKFAYASLAEPDPTPIVTSDSSRAVAAYILAVVPSRLGPIIDAHKAGDPVAAQAIADTYPQDRQDGLMMRAFNAKLAAIPTDKLNELDADGRLAIGISERMVAFADLSKAHYQTIATIMEDIRVFDQARATPADPPLVDQVIAYAKVKEKLPQISVLLASAGMDPDTATTLGMGVHLTGNSIAEDLGAVTLTHQSEVLGPLAPFFPGGFF